MSAPPAPAGNPTASQPIFLEGQQMNNPIDIAFEKRLLAVGLGKVVPLSVQRNIRCRADHEQEPIEKKVKTQLKAGRLAQQRLSRSLCRVRPLRFPKHKNEN